jgi:hypothetical protein
MTMPPERSRDEVDREFEAIVAGWTPSVPESEPPEQPATPEPPAPTSSWVVLPESIWRGPTNEEPISAIDDPAAMAEDDEHFEPPPVTLPAVEDLSYWGALAGLILGPLVVIYAVVAEPFSQTLIVTLGVLAFVGGFALLLWRQPARREDFDSGDDGSRV